MVGSFDLYLAIVHSDGEVGAIIVSTPQDVALADVQKGIAMFRKVSVPVRTSPAEKGVEGEG